MSRIQWFFRAESAALLAATVGVLAACGGGGSSSGGSYALGGSVSGLTANGLILADGTDTLSIAAGASAFAFGGSTGSYPITVKSQPSGQTCTLANGVGTASAASVIVTCRGYMAYVTNAGSSTGTVATFSLDPATGALSAASAAPIATGIPLQAIAVSDDGLHAYTTNYRDKGVSAYAIAGDGSLSLLGTVNAVSESLGLTVGPGSDKVYVTNYADKSISQFGVGATGALTALSPATVAAGSTPYAIAVSPNGRFAYAVNGGGNTISQYGVGGSGALTALSVAAVSTSAVGTGPTALAIDPMNSSYVYVALAGSARILQYTIGATGLLTPMSPASVPSGSAPGGIAISPDGRCAFVANSADDTVTPYNIAGGGLTAAANGAIPAGNNPTAVAVSPDSRFVYVANAGSANVSQYSIVAGCELTAVATIASGGAGFWPTGIAVR